MYISIVLQGISCTILLVFCFHHHAGQKNTIPDTTQCRDHQTDQQILPVTFAPDIDAFFSSKTTNCFLIAKPF